MIVVHQNMRYEESRKSVTFHLHSSTFNLKTSLRKLNYTFPLEGNEDKRLKEMK